MTSPDAFYKSAAIVARYEEGRSNRVFVRHLPRLIRLLRYCKKPFFPPLASIFDWIYTSRMSMLTDDLLTSPVLDIACGTSYFYRSAIAEGWQGQVSGFDSSPAMIDEGSKALQYMTIRRDPTYIQDKGIFFYRDALGRKTVDIAPPAEIIHLDSILHLLGHRTIWNIELDVDDTFSTITAFSGPFCFFSHKDQSAILQKIASNTTHNMVLQFKNSAFFNMNSSPEVIRQIADVIRYIFQHRIADSYAFLHSINFDKVMKPSTTNVVATRHESGDFDYYLNSVEQVQSWINDIDFAVLKIGTMGFMSETFYALALEYYEKSVQDHSFELFVRALIGIDDYFCMKLLMGDNLHICAVKRQIISIESMDFRFTKTYRTNYEADTNTDIEGRWP